MQKQKGFTLIELIVVIAIIAVLAAIVAVNTTSYIQKAKVAAIQADLKQASVAAAQYYADHQTYNGFCDAQMGSSGSCNGLVGGSGTTCCSGGDPSWQKICQAIVSQGAYPYCEAPDTASNCSAGPYAAAAMLGGNVVSCVDSTGKTATDIRSTCACN